MSEIILTTLNARYAHASFGLRYLMANLGEVRGRAKILEFEINQRPLDVVEAILRERPTIVGLGIYIWNAQQARQVVASLKRVAPEVVVVLGGPEVSYETEQQEIARLADYVICGEGDVAFRSLCECLLAGERPTEKVIAAAPPTFDQLELPYDLYGADDIAHRVIYVEASRGCPFKCEFCLSSLDNGVRAAPLERFLPEMQKLLDRGVRHFKFVDRTFNLNIRTGVAILQFFLERFRPGLFLHFEMIPDRLPEELRELIKKFPPGALQFEVGIQTFNEDVARLISRRQDNAKAEANLRFLRTETGVHVHSDLIVGLPGEDVASFAAGFDRLVALGPQEIQVGILKRLRGTPIVRHDREWQMVYSPEAPYEVLSTKLIDFATMQRLRRFGRYWDLIANSGNFVRTTPLIWRGESPLWSFMKLSDWLYGREGRTHGIALARLGEMVFEYLTTEPKRDAAAVAQALRQDYRNGGRRDVPEFLRNFVTAAESVSGHQPAALSRQRKHLQTEKAADQRR